MTTQSVRIERDPLARALKWSAIGHLGLFAGVIFIELLRGFAFPKKELRLVPTMRVDLVALPTHLPKEHIPSGAKPDHADLSKKEVAETTRQILKSRPPKKITAADRRIDAKNQRALERIKSLAKVELETETEEPVKGNRLSKGRSQDATAQEGEITPEANYLEALKERLQNHWELPPWLARRQLGAQVRLFIDARGILKSSEIAQSSGNPQFDLAVQKALDQSQPFPKPPIDLQHQLVSDGILVGFPL